jgi:hypothetical protein
MPYQQLLNGRPGLSGISVAQRIDCCSACRLVFVTGLLRLSIECWWGKDATAEQGGSLWGVACSVACVESSS